MRRLLTAMIVLLALVGSIAPASAAPITPPPVTFNGCQFTVPSSDDYTYELQYQASGVPGIPLDAGQYDAGMFAIPDVTAVVNAVPILPDTTVPDGETSQWPLPDTTTCASPISPDPDAALVDVSAACTVLTFTNLVDDPVGIVFSDTGADAPDLVVPASGKATFDVDPGSSVDFLAAVEDGDDVQVGSVDVPTCATPAPVTGGAGGGSQSGGSEIPTVAPAAGI